MKSHSFRCLSIRGPFPFLPESFLYKFDLFCRICREKCLFFPICGRGGIGGSVDTGVGDSKGDIIFFEFERNDVCLTTNQRLKLN